MTDMTFWGMAHMIGQKVTVMIGGIDMGDYTVAADGSVGVNFAADTQGLVTSAYIISISGADITAYGDLTAQLDLTDALGTTTSYFIPVVIGNAYTSEGQQLRPDPADHVKTPMGPGLAKTRRVHQYGLLLNNTTGSVYIGTDLTGTMTVPLELNGLTYSNSQLMSGVVWNTLDDQHSFEGQLAWRVTRPTPLTVCSTAIFMETAER